MPDTKLCSELNGLLSIATRCRKNGNYRAAEKLMLHAINKAEERFGKESLAVGMLLLELIDVYNELNEEDSAAQAQARMQAIIQRAIDCGPEGAN